METRGREREPQWAASKANLIADTEVPKISQARSDLESLERSYRKSSRTLQSMVLGLVFAVLVVLAYGLFGGRVEREKFTTDVTPIHVELNPISGRRQTAQNRLNMQM